MIRINLIKIMHCLWMGVLFTSSAVAAAITPIDLNDFFPSEIEVITSLDGETATIGESDLIAVVTLENDPVFDPEVIVAVPSRILAFNYDFQEATGNDDAFSAILFDSAAGPINGVLNSFVITSTQTGTKTFELSPWIGTTLGLSFELSDMAPLAMQLGSTVTVGQLRLIDPTVVPLPPSILMLFSGVLALAARRRDWSGSSLLGRGLGT